MTDESKPEVEIYTDGACSGNPGPGGWGAVLRSGRHEKEVSGGEAGSTTNNRMELTAPILALRQLKQPSVVHIHTDSTYVCDGVTKWLPRWKTNGWRTRGGDPVKNADLWQELDAAAEPHEVSWRWVKGHAGDPLNERADQLAAGGMRQAIASEQVPAVSSARSTPSLGTPAPEKVPDDVECVHEMPRQWCATCKKPPSGVLNHGYRTRGGNAYHNDPECRWLRHGQQRAERLGKNVHDVERVSWGSVLPGELEPCDHCCTPQWLRRHGHTR